MNTEEFAKTTVTKNDIKQTNDDDSGDYVISQNKTITRIFVILAILIAIVFWLFSVNESMKTDEIAVTADDISIPEEFAGKYQVVLPEKFTVEIRGRKTVMHYKKYTAKDLNLSVNIDEISGDGAEFDLIIELPKGEKILLNSNEPVRVKVQKIPENIPETSTIGGNK